MANAAAPPQLSPSTASFLQCATQLLSPNTSPEVRRQADEWLNRFQLGVEAWSAVDEVLKYVTDETVVFLAAQTLNKKIRYDRDQLGTARETWDGLREAVMLHLMKHSDQPVVCTQLALGLVALMIQMDSWTGAIPDLLRVLEQKPSTLLEVLRLIPEEVDDPSLDVSSDRRFAFKREMLDLTPVIIGILSQRARTSDVRLLLDCTRAWIAFSDVPGSALVESRLLDIAKDIIIRGEFSKEFDAACELYIETVHRYHTLDPEDLPVLNSVVPNVFAMEPTYDAACARKYDEVVGGIARVFSHFTEAYVPMLLGQNEIGQLQFAQIALKVFSHEDFRVARKAYYFWMDILDGLARLTPVELRMQRVAQLQPVLDHLVVVCYRRMIRTPDNMDSDDEDDVGGASDDDEDGDGAPRLSEFETHRLEVGEVLRALMYASADSASLAHAGPRLAEICTSVNSVTELEGALLAFRSVAKDMSFSMADSTSGKAIARVLEVGIRRSPEDITIRKATCDVISEVAEQISQNPEAYVTATTSFLIDSLRVAGGHSTRHAARAFRHICMDRCAAFLFPELERIFDALSPYDPALDEDSRFDLLEAIVLIWVEGLVRVVQRGSDADRVRLRTLFQKFSTPPLTALSTCVAEAQKAARSNSPVSPQLADVAIMSLHSLTVFVRFSRLPRNVGAMTMNGGPSELPEAVDLILDKIWPALATFTVLPDKAMESLCRFIKHATRTFPQYVRPHIRTILEFLVTRYQQAPISGNLYICGVIFQEYFDCPELLSYFPITLSALCQASFDRVLVSPDAFIQHPDFVEDLFYLGNRTVEYIPEVIVQSDAFDRLIGMGAVVGLTLEHREAFRSVAVFLENAIALGIVAVHEDAGGRMDDRFRPFVANALERHGRALVASVIQGIAGGLSAERVAEQGVPNGTLGHVLYTLWEFWGTQHFSALVSDSLVQQPHLSNELRGSFLQRLIKAADANGVPQFLDVCADFSWTARRRRKRALS